MSNFKNIDYGRPEGDVAVNDTYMFTQKLLAEIVAEQDEYVMIMIEEYVKKARANGECVNAQIIPEGKLRHIINLGLSVYAEQNSLKIQSSGQFPEQMYVEYLRRENDELRRKLNNLESE